MKFPSANKTVKRSALKGLFRVERGSAYRGPRFFTARDYTAEPGRRSRFCMNELSRTCSIVARTFPGAGEGVEAKKISDRFADGMASSASASGRTHDSPFRLHHFILM